MTIIVIEDDPKIREELTILLTHANYEVVQITDFNTVIEQVRTFRGDLLLLDINLPYLDGFHICKTLRESISIPIIFVTSRNTQQDELKSIIMGGTDFITKPYDKALLLHKIERALQQHDVRNFKELTVKGVTLDLHLAKVSFNDKKVELTRNEFRILYYFFLHPQKILSKDQLIEYLWNDKYYLDESILVVNINRLRKKLQSLGLADNFIETVRGKGYRV